MLKESIGKRFDIVSTVKPNAPSANVLEDLRKLGEDFTKQDHTVIVGGPENSLDRNYNYLLEKDINFIADRIANTNVGFVNLFQRHDKQWMNKRVRSMNLWLDWALMWRDMSHISVINVSSIERDDNTRHGLHLNSRGKKRLTQLIAERVMDGHVSSTYIIPVITHDRASPFLD
jgi:hypothetical protein